MTSASTPACSPCSKVWRWIQISPGRATIPDAPLHQLSARHGFNLPSIAASAQALLDAAELALADDTDLPLLAPLQSMLRNYEPPTSRLINAYRLTGSIEAALRQSYLQ